MPFKANVALQFLARAKDKGRLGHAYLISGPKEADLPGFAVKTLNLVSGERWPDLEAWESHGALVLRPESKSRQIRIETIREQVEPFLYVTTSGAAHRFCVFVDAERMNQATQNAFLRTLEEPPPRTLFLLLSTQPEQFLETTLSRVIRIALLPETNTRKLSAPEVKLVRLLTDLANRPTDSLAGALSLRKEFDDILTEIEDRLTKELESQFDEEKKFYKQTTDVDNAWLKDREEESKAAIEARYRQERDGLMELLLAWLGDVLRHQVGVSRLDLPEHAAATSVLAQRWEPATVSRRIKELRRLHSNLHTNVQENLALDAAFVAAFA